jgi:hypothetical protein
MTDNQTTTRCPECGGVGNDGGDPPIICQECGGSGAIELEAAQTTRRTFADLKAALSPEQRARAEQKAGALSGEMRTDTTETNDQDDITLERWIALERLRLDEFVAFWRNGQAGNNMDGIPVDAFPTKQPVGEWDEQYRSWGGA